MFEMSLLINCSTINYDTHGNTNPAFKHSVCGNPLIFSVWNDPLEYGYHTLHMHPEIMTVSGLKFLKQYR